MKVVITGGDGFLGCHNAEHVLRTYPESTVTVIDTLARARGENVAYLKQRYPGRVSLLEADVTDLDAIAPSFAGADRVYHMAAQVSVVESVRDPLRDYHVNSTGTMNVLEAVRTRCDGAAVVFCSSNKVYGDLIRVFHDPVTGPVLAPIDPARDITLLGDAYQFSGDLASGIAEDEFHVGPEAASTPYGSSKIAGETWMKDYHDTYGMRTVRARMSCVYGPRQFGTEEQGWVAWFVMRAIAGSNVVVYGDGHQARDLLHVSDQARAFDLLASTPACAGHAFNLGGGPSMVRSVSQVLDMVADLVGHRLPVRHEGWRHGDQKIFSSNIQKIRRFTGFEPVVTPAEGVRDLVGWARENLDLVTRVAGPALARAL